MNHLAHLPCLGFFQFSGPAGALKKGPDAQIDQVSSCVIRLYCYLQQVPCPEEHTLLRTFGKHPTDFGS